MISGLMGIRASTGDLLTINPLTPANWTHFALENVPYHGHNITIEYDRDGTYYHVGTGYKIFVDGKRVSSAVQVTPITIRLHGSSSVPPAPQLVNDAANPLRTGYPQPIASYTWQTDNAWNGLDGKTWFNEIPEDTRWTNYASPHQQDYYGVDFGVKTDVSDVRFYGYDDGGGVRPAAGYTLQYWTGSQCADVPNQAHSPQVPVGNGLNRITFPSVDTSRIRLLFDNPTGAFVGVTELQSWSPSSTATFVTVNNGAGVSVLPGRTVTVSTPEAAGSARLP
ncbi:MAG: glycosyl hydrolase family 65 protein [Nakamurella sp.]